MGIKRLENISSLSNKLKKEKQGKKKVESIPQPSFKEILKQAEERLNKK